VTKDVPDLALVAGVPARRIGWVGRAGVPARRIGWVGRADVRLEPAGDGMWRCSQTGELHRERDGVLTVV
jgi:hypothetical protein